jgi:MscS family membrane protein
MKYRRFYCRISLRYQDIVKVPAILEEIKSLLKENSAIDKNRSITVNLNELANTSLNLVVIAYTHTVNSADFLTIQQALFLQLLACIQRHGAEWSFPSHNVYLNNAEGIELASSQNRNDR